MPRLARLDVVAGPVTGPASDPETATAPGTQVVRSFEPTPDVVGQSDPFEDLWLYANPIFVDVF